MKIRLYLTALFPLLGCLTGCYTQLYTGGYAERTVYPYPYDRSVSPRDSIQADSLDSVAAADTLRNPKTVIVNNYYDNSPYYKGYSIDAWDYPYVSLGFYSGRYRDYYGPYWWNDGYAHRGHYRRSYGSYPGGGSAPGPSHPDTRLFPLPSPQPPLHKGRRSEPAPAAAKPAAPAPAVAAPAASAPPESSQSSSSDGSSSSGSSNSSSGSDRPNLHKGRR